MATAVSKASDFNIILNSNTVFATNTALKDFTWAYNFSNVEDGDYEVGFTFQSGNATGITSQTSNLPCLLTLSIGVNPQQYVAGALVSNQTSNILGQLNVNWFSATLATFVANATTNHPVIIKGLNRASNFIRMSLIGGTGAIIGTGVANWFVVLNFTKVN